MHARTLGDDTLSFGVSGALWRDAMVMFDRESGSYWSHVTGECIEGPRRGARLTVLPAAVAPFAEWAQAHPGTRFLVRPADSEARSRYQRYAESDRQGIFGTRARRAELPPKALVQGVAHGGEGAAIPHAALAGRREVAFTLAGARFVARREHGAVAVWRRGARGALEPHPSTPAYWFAWLNFYPRTAIVR